MSHGGGLMLKIAVPRYADEIAPLFDAATHISIYQVEREQPILVETVKITSAQELDSVRRLQEAGISILICNGISQVAKSILQARGITVINKVTGGVESALKAFYNGKLCGSDGDPIFQRSDARLGLKDLLDQTRELFSKHGYNVHTGGDKASFPVDLVAEIACPACGKTIRVAICCGMHTHRLDDEIRAFHNIASGSFDAMVYANFAPEEVDKTCAEFGIQAINPSRDRRPGKVVPLLKGHLGGHDHCARSR
jgi:predicted Fe-Mo cluster-binding NifX family protein